MSRHVCVMMLVLVDAATAAVAGEGSLATPVSLETRWWNEHEFVWRLAEAAGKRWAIVDGISGRGWAGADSVPAEKTAADFERSTGIRVESIAGVFVAHRPQEDKRKGLEDKLAAGGEEAVRAAWLLGWLKDARAWPALARSTTSRDTAVALSAAVALRRLDGEENFDIRRWIPCGGERQGALLYDGKDPDAGLTQVPLGACFADVMASADLAALAGSRYVPLREAAARIAAGSADGERIVEKLATDPSLTVRQAAARAARAWKARPANRPRPVLRPDLARLREELDGGKQAASAAAAWLAAFGSDEDVRRLIKLDEAAFEALLHKAGGPAILEYFRDIAASGQPWPSTNQVYSGKAPRIGSAKYALAMLCDGDKLAAELGPRLGTEHWSLSSELLLARFSGPSALPHFTGRILELRGHVAPLAVGFIGGPDGVRMIAPLLESEDLSIATSAARGLGESGQLSAVAPLIKALDNPNRVVRSRSALALGRLGGPEAARALAALLEREKEYLPRRSACEMLREIESGEEARSDLTAAVGKELAGFAPAYNPVNPGLGDDFPEGKLVDLGRIRSIVAVGEIRCAVDAHSGIWMFYGGCSGGYNNQAMGYDVASGKWFVIRPPEMTGLFYNETRPGAGCSRGMTYDARSRRVWINNATRAPRHANEYNWAMTFAGGHCCSYDPTTDRFDGPFPDPRGSGGMSGTYYVADTSRGQIYSEVMASVQKEGGPTQVVDATSGSLKEIKFERLPGGLNAFYVHEAAGYDPVSDLILREIRRHNFKRRNQPAEDFGLWLLDPASGVARKSKSPLPGERASGASGTQLMFDCLNREIVAFRTEGVFAYDRKEDSWRKVADEDGGFYTYAFDPQHNVFIGTGGPHNLRLMAFRLKNVQAGTKAFFGGER